LIILPGSTKDDWEALAFRRSLEMDLFGAAYTLGYSGMVTEVDYFL
jgi:hypothetical protein